MDEEFVFVGHHRDQFEKVPCTVRPRQVEPDRVITEFDPGDAVFSRVQHVCVNDVVLCRRRENLR